MTQPRPKMRYPKGRGVFVRDCTVAICLNNNPGAVLLSTLLFWYDNPHKFDTYQGDDFTMCRTQVSIEEQACHQIDVKTIHDTAVPLLQLLGYLTVVEKMNGNLYTLHMDRVLAGYAAYENGPSCLKAYLKASMQLESALIIMAPSELESALINKNWLYFELERVLIATRADSNCKRGRKPKQQAAREAKMASTETYRDSIETLDKEREERARAFSENGNKNHSHLGHNAWNCEAWCNAHGKSCADYQAYIDSGAREDTPTEPRVEAIKPPVAIASTSGEEASPPVALTRQSHTSSSLSDVDGAVKSGGIVTRPRASDEQPTPVSLTAGSASPPATQMPAGAGPPKRQRKKPAGVQLSTHEAEIKTWYEELRDTECELTKRTVTAIQSLAARRGTESKEVFLNVVAVIDIDPWFEKNKVGVDLYWIDRQWENKYIFLQRKKPHDAPQLHDGERHSDFDEYVGNGPEARKWLREEGAKLKAQGFCPDL